MKAHRRRNSGLPEWVWSNGFHRVQLIQNGPNYRVNVMVTGIHHANCSFVRGYNAYSGPDPDAALAMVQEYIKEATL